MTDLEKLAQEARDGLVTKSLVLPPEKSREKVYHHTVPGSTFYDKKGTMHQWNIDGELKTDSEDLIRELDAIADKPGSPVYTKDAPARNPALGNPVDEIQAKAALAMKQLEDQRAKMGG